MVYLNTALTNFRAAVDRAYPNRDRSSDGWIGDPDHLARDSDHNPDLDGSVDAWDMDVDLRSGDDARSIEHLKDVFEAHPAARYWIHNRQIAHRSTGWRRDVYDGDNPHNLHVHWNSNEATEDSTAPWILGDDMTPLELINTRLGSPALGDRTVGDWWKAGEAARREIAAARVELGALNEELAALKTDLGGLKTDLAALQAAIEAGPGGVTLEMHEAALRKVLGSVDEVPPA